MGFLSKLFASKKPPVQKKPPAPKIEGKASSWERGIVKRYNKKKGYGFVTVGNTDVFIHNSTLPKGTTTLKEGQAVQICYGKAPKGLMATALKLS